ncbi:carboxypeptidase regulatory-like domain-containing protein [bacterium]|nr:carboxypeptidase regulatory-like domain-containing protein [bacterium]
MTHQKLRQALFLGAILLAGGCDARSGAFYQSLGAMNGGAAPSNVAKVRVDTDATNDSQVSDHTNVVVATPDQPGGFTVTMTSETGTLPSLPAETAFVRLTVSAPDLSTPLVKILTHSATENAAVASFSVPLGSNRTLSIAAKDETGKILARGSRQGLQVESGRFAPLTMALSRQLGNLYGQVLNEMTFTPEQGVVVTMGDTSSITDQHGVYRLEGLAPGAQVISFEKALFASATRSIEVRVGDQTDPATQLLSPQ